ncbi:MAG: hypothetical protein ACRD2E_13775 [Terriglobales bacterium]
MTRGFGYNSVVEWGGETFHVQTEPCRRGREDTAAVETTIFRGGQVRYSRRTDCDGADEAAIRELVRNQHGEVIAELRAGRLPENLGR